MSKVFPLFPPDSGLPTEAVALPVAHILPELCASLQQQANAVLCAPPGAGKTTLTPLALLHTSWMRESAAARIIMLEPRRLAARAAARRMSALLGEACGQTVGYRMRMDSCVSKGTRIEVVTEGVLTRMVQDDPELKNVACVIFDEFHERSLQADTGLALCLDVQAALRPDLRLVVMSATLDSEAVAHLLGDCPVHISEGRSWPVDIRYVPPRTPRVRMEDHVAAVVRHVLQHQDASTGDSGSVLVFLPGTAEIRRVEALLGAHPAGHGAAPVTVYPLYGDLPPALQDEALTPCTGAQRKVVLATAIAETSLTIEGVRIVVDAGLCRSAVFDPATGMGRLVTGRVSLAAAQQRAGRAGRTESGVAYRLWQQQEEMGMRAYARPEILEADLTPLVLQLALWGVTEAASLAWMDAPPEAALRHAREVLHQLGALNEQDRITDHGRALSTLPLHPRLGHMLLQATTQTYLPLACCVAALLGERPAQRGTDVRVMTAHMLRQDGPWPLAERLRKQAQRLHQIVGQILGPLARRKQDGKNAMAAPLKSTNFFAAAHTHMEECGVLLATAWPQWIAQNVGAGQFRLRNGRMATLPEDDALAREPFLAVAALDDRNMHIGPLGQSGQMGRAVASRQSAPAGPLRRARIFAAAPLTHEALDELFATAMQTQDSVVWDTRTETVLARRRLTLDALILQDSPLPKPDATECMLAAAQGMAALGLAVLPWTEDLRQWQARVQCMHYLEGNVWPLVSDAALLATLEEWLMPYLAGCTRREHFRRVDLAAALHTLLPWDMRARLDKELPTHVEVPTGSRLQVDYTAEGGPVLAVKLQEMFGCAHTPHLAGGRIPLTLHLTSPAGRPLQVTQDLAGFWAGSYAAVRAEMRGRYPRHPWPDDPATALPTRYTKNRAARMAAKGNT